MIDSYIYVQNIEPSEYRPITVRPYCTYTCVCTTKVMVHRRMRQLSLTETNTFVNLAKHALETLNASDDEDPGAKDGAPDHYSDDGNTADDNLDDNDEYLTAAGVAPTSLKTIQSEPVFKKQKHARLGAVSGMEQTEEAPEDIEMDTRWLGSVDAADDDVLHFVARSTSDIELENVDNHRDGDEDAEPSGDEKTHLATANAAKNLFLC